MSLPPSTWKAVSWQLSLCAFQLQLNISVKLFRYLDFFSKFYTNLNRILKRKYFLLCQGKHIPLCDYWTFHNLRFRCFAAVEGSNRMIIMRQWGPLDTSQTNFGHQPLLLNDIVAWQNQIYIEISTWSYSRCEIPVANHWLGDIRRQGQTQCKEQFFHVSDVHSIFKLPEKKWQ